MKYVIAELTDDYIVKYIENVTNLRKILDYIDNYSLDEGGVYMYEDHIKHYEFIFENNGILYWVDKNLGCKFCLVDINYTFDSKREATPFKIFNQLKPLIRDVRINEILSVPL
jgi:hypothetical protein